MIKLNTVLDYDVSQCTEYAVKFYPNTTSFKTVFLEKQSHPVYIEEIIYDGGGVYGFEYDNEEVIINGQCN